MSLTEPQIVRFSRQILLRDVGGRGQERLLGSVWRVTHAAPGLDVAVTYLQASGVTVTGVASFSKGPGYLHGVTSADSLPRSPGLPLGTLSTLGHAEAFRAPGAHVVLGADGLLFAPGPLVSAQRLKLEALVAVGAPVGALSVCLGSAMALVAQRLILGLERGAGALRWRDGRFTATPLES